MVVINKLKKRLSSILLSFAIIVGMAPMAGAQQGPTLRTETLAAATYETISSGVQPVTAPMQLIGMSANAQKAEPVIAQALLQGQRIINVEPYHITQEELLQLVEYSTFSSYPQISGVLGYEYTVDSQNIVYGIMPRYQYSQQEIVARTAQIEQAAQAVLNSVITDQMTTLQKIVAIHDYLVLNCRYDTRVETNSAPQEVYTAYGALIDQVAVCQGYAAAFQLFMQKLEIPSIVVQSQAMNHAWNMVRYENNWYHVDATWDDPVPDQPGVVHTQSLLKSDQWMMNLPTTPYHSWNSAGYTAVNTQFDGDYDWSAQRMYRTAVMKGAQVERSAVSGSVGNYYEFVVTPYVAGTKITLTSSNPSIVSVEPVSTSDSGAIKYRAVFQLPGAVTLLATTADGGIDTLKINVSAASLAA